MKARTTTKHMLAAAFDTGVGRWAATYLLRAALFGYGYNRYDDLVLSGEAWFCTTMLPKLGVSSAVDCGANEGDYSRLLLQSLSGPVWAIDPDPRVANGLRHLARQYPGRLSYLGIALGETDGSSTLHMTDSAIWSTLVAKAPGYVNNARKSQHTVVVRSLDSLVDDGTLADVDFLKLDAEGYELEILRGAQRLVASASLKAIQFEFGAHNLMRSQTLADLMESLPGYRVHRLLSRSLIPVDVHAPIDTIPLFCNYVALR